MSYYDIGMISGLTILADIRFDDIILISECRHHIMAADVGAMSLEPAQDVPAVEEHLSALAADLSGEVVVAPAPVAHRRGPRIRHPSDVAQGDELVIDGRQLDFLSSQEYYSSHLAHYTPKQSYTARS